MTRERHESPADPQLPGIFLIKGGRPNGQEVPRTWQVTDVAVGESFDESLDSSAGTVPL